jgi:hypothetical protein
LGSVSTLTSTVTRSASSADIGSKRGSFTAASIAESMTALTSG